ncbi:MAG: SprT-like domain-containing protein [Arcanobacterium sp.]|nr:SprT-like domain-containing protein [Arcanobacterium sp.]
MQLSEVANLARELLAKHGLTSWNIQFDRAKRRAGATHFQKQLITLSPYFMENFSEAEVRDTILHEIAHALAGPGAGHGPKWKKICHEIGAKPIARLKTNAAQRGIDAPWKGTCPNGHEFSRFRKPSRESSCSICARKFNPNYIITWTRNNEEPK